MRTAGLDDDQVESQGQVRHRRPVREDATLEQAVRGGPNARAFPVIDGLLRQAERPDSLRQRTSTATRVRGGPGIDRHEVELVATDVDVPGEDDPACRGQTVGDQGLGAVS